MIDYVYGHDELVAHFVARMIPSCRDRGFGKCKAIGVVDTENNKLIAGIVFHNWQPEAGVIEMSVAAIPGTHWLTRETVQRMGEYAFLQAGAQMVLQLTPADDERTLRQLAVAGYLFVPIPPVPRRERECVNCLMTREAWEQCKFRKRREHERQEAA